MNLIMHEKFETLEDLLVFELQDLYDAEKRLTDALPRMAEAASAPELKTAFQNHLGETKEQVKRLEKAFEMLGKSPKRDSCDAMKGLISEGEDVLSAKADDALRDAAIIAAAQRVEHYEMAGYGAARNFAKRVGRDDIASLLQETLDEEGDANHRLTAIAEEWVNPQATTA